MAENSSIEWTDATWNPIAGCSITSPGCHNCYAMLMASRLEAMGQKKYMGTTKKVNGKTLWTGKLSFDRAALEIPFKKKKHTRYFVNSMSDLFHEDVAWDTIDEIFAVIYECQWHTFQILTKRAQGMFDYLACNATHFRIAQKVWQRYRDTDEEKARMVSVADILSDLDGMGPLSNVWLGVSAEDQQRAEERIHWLRKTPAAIRFILMEPLLGPIDVNIIAEKNAEQMPCCDNGLCEYCAGTGIAMVLNIQWIIVGGESGPGARPCNVEWIRSIVKQCKAAGVACFVKQVGSKCIDTDDCEDGEFWQLKKSDAKGGDWNEWPADLRVREFPVL